MADQTLDQLIEDTSPQATDLLLIKKTGVTIPQKIQYSNLISGNGGIIKREFGIPANIVYVGGIIPLNGQTITTFINQPDIPRSVRFAYSNVEPSGPIDYVVQGTDYFDNPITENLTQAANIDAIETTRAFKTLTLVTVGTDPSTLITVSSGSVLGLNVLFDKDTRLQFFINNIQQTNFTQIALAVDPVNISLNTMTVLGSGVDGTSDYLLYLLAP